MSTAEARTALLQLVAEHQRSRCAELRAAAEVQAAGIVREAWRGARTRLHENVHTLKQERRRALALASAELETARRQHRQRCDRVLLEAAWAPLRDALRARWQEPAARRAWVEDVARRALARLPRGRWRIAHPPDWPAAERGALFEQLARTLGVPPEASVEAGIAAGLRIACDTAQFDATLDGLLADRGTVEALLLAEVGE